MINSATQRLQPRRAASPEGRHGSKASLLISRAIGSCRKGLSCLEQTMANDAHTPTRLIRLPEVKLRTGLARSSIYRMMEDGGFPRPRKLGPRAVAWLVNDIDQWINSRPAKPTR
jgi:prophage regulatory protein